MARNPIKSLDKPATVAAVFSDPGGSDCCVPGWDKRAGNEQSMERVAKRAKMGLKKTPLGRGTLMPARR